MALNNVTTGFPKSVIPDSVVSRPDDDRSSSDVTTSIGIVINPNETFDKFAARISNNTERVTRARLFDYSQSTYVSTTDISALSAGDPFIIESEIVSGTDYGVELDNDGSEWDVGFYDSDPSWPITGDEIDLVARSSDGLQNDPNDLVAAVNDIGNPDNVLD